MTATEPRTEPSTKPTMCREHDWMDASKRRRRKTPRTHYSIQCTQCAARIILRIDAKGHVQGTRTQYESFERGTARDYSGIS